MTAPAPRLVLHVIHHLVTGGMENGLVNLINLLPPQHYRHAIACIEDFSEFRNRIQRPDVEVFPLHRSNAGVWSVRKQLFDLCRRLRPSIVHSRNQSGLDALLPARLAGVRNIVHGEHGWDVDNIRGENWRPLWNRRLHSPLVSRYITVSLDIKNHLINRVGIAPTRISQIYNGVDTERYSPRQTRPDFVAPPGFLEPDSVVIGTIGRIQPVKAQATLLNAFADLLRNDSDLRARLRLAIVGAGPLLESLRELALTLGISAQCWFPSARSDIPQILQLFDIFVLPSLNEGISNTILEAMATGLPVIASRVGGNVELIDEAKSGELFAPGDIHALAALLGRYAHSAELRGNIGRAARERAVTHFSLPNMVAKYQSVYAGLA